MTSNWPPVGNEFNALSCGYQMRDLPLPLPLLIKQQQRMKWYSQKQTGNIIETFDNCLFAIILYTEDLLAITMYN